jgi:NitT/TauT family transport system substrate-binding protein
MDASAARNSLKVLGSFSPNVKGKQDTVDLSKTYTTRFVDKAK